MRHLPEGDNDRAEVKRERIEPWMLDAIALNPGYVQWGPYEDYMWKPGEKEPDPAPPKNIVEEMFTPRKSSGWDARVLLDHWSDMWELDELNEVVNFYFYAQRDSKECEACEGTGHNPATKLIADTFYPHSSPTGEFWHDKITQDEVEALVAKGRLWDFTRGNKAMPTAADVNAQQHGLHSHDAINRWILVETRAKRLGVWGDCEACGGHGDIFTADAARLGLVLWMIHPRKGCSRGIDIKNITQDELPAVRQFLAGAAARNAERFAKAVQGVEVPANVS